MEWHDEGIVLSSRPHGETGAILELLTRHHGRHLGIVRGGRSRRQRPVLQPGNKVAVRWSARLPEHLGLYVVDPKRLRAGGIMAAAAPLLALQSMCALAGSLAEREVHEAFFEATDLLIDRLGVADDWPALLVIWEIRLLAELGFGLDLSCCAATGSTDDLVYVSPKSGRAVSGAAGAPFRDRLLPLPHFILAGRYDAVGSSDLRDGLRMTAVFLENALRQAAGKGLPEVRQRLYSSI